jgi:membrane protein involved in colicin uptake
MNTKAQFIEIDEAQFPTKFRPLLQRLNADALDPDITLLLETEALVEESRNREIKEYQKRQEKSQEQNKKLHESLLNERKAKIEAQRKQEEAQRKQIEAQRKQEEERNARIEAQRKQEEAQRNSIKTLLKYGIKPEEIATELNLPIDEVNRIIKTL